MKTVKISELKANLSAHLRLVSAGEEVVVCDRKRPIARIVPVIPAVHLTREERLIAKGVMKAPSKPADEPRFVPNPVGNHVISQAVMDTLWEEERADRA